MCVCVRVCVCVCVRVRVCVLPAGGTAVSRTSRATAVRLGRVRCSRPRRLRRGRRCTVTVGSPWTARAYRKDTARRKQARPRTAHKSTHTHTHTCHRHTHTHTRDFFKTANSPKFQKIKWSNVYCCVNISLTRNALEHVHLEDEFVQNQLLIAGRLTRFPSHTLP